MALALIFVSGSAPGASATLTGTAISGLTEAQITTGGETIIVTLTNDTFKAAGTGPIGTTAETQALIDGLTSDGAEGTGWNAEVRDKESTTSVVRDSNTQATLTLSAAAAFDVTADETITWTIPVDVLVTGAAEIVATPTFTVTADALGGGGGAYGKKRRRIRKEGRKKFELDDSKYLAEGFLKKLAEGVVEVAGVEVALQQPVELPPPAPPQPTQSVEILEDQTWQEIAQILRADAVDEYEQKIGDYLERMERLELEVQFVVMTLLDDDF